MYPCCNDFLYCCHGINLHPIPSPPLRAYFLISQYFWRPTTITFSISLMSTSLELSSSYILNAQRNLSSGLLQRTRPGVNYAKDWLNHLFLFPSDVHLLVWSVKVVLPMALITRTQSTTILAWWRQTNKQVILVQACSWPLRKKSFAICR